MISSVKYSKITSAPPSHTCAPKKYLHSGATILLLSLGWLRHWCSIKNATRCGSGSQRPSTRFENVHVPRTIYFYIFYFLCTTSGNMYFHSDNRIFFLCATFELSANHIGWGTLRHGACDPIICLISLRHGVLSTYVTSAIPLIILIINYYNYVQG